MYDTSHPIARLLTLLVATPARIAAATVDLSAAQLRAAPAPGEWSANDVLAHLRACADVWGGCIATILAEDEPTFKAVNPTTWIKQTNYLEIEFRPSLDAFTAQRTALLAVLEPVSYTHLTLPTGGPGMFSVVAVSLKKKLTHEWRGRRRIR